ncbi:MAG TPA: EAL domain-containing protein [Gammaproteobacteria bacterium]|nr:EAL domain-containing protein [Gammaproteobacteria bacterium]
MLRNENSLHSSAQQTVLWKVDTDTAQIIYRNAHAPTLLMLLCAMACVWLLQDTEKFGLLVAWVFSVVGLTVARLLSGNLFERATPVQQASPVWRYLLLACACALGGLWSFFAIVFIPVAELSQQLLLLGLLFLVAGSTSIGLAVSFLLFACYAVCGFLPIIWVYLNADSAVLRGLGLLVLITFATIAIAVIQVNRLIYQTSEQRAKNQHLIHTLRIRQQQADALNAELRQEVAGKYVAEQQLLAVQAGLEQSVSERTSELKEALLALEKIQERLELALDASQLALWDWNLETDEIHHTRIKSIFGLEDNQVRGVLRDLRPLLHPDDLPVLRNAMLEHMKRHTESYMVEYRIKHSDGHWVWIEDRGQAVERDGAGRVLRMLGTRRDITERKQHDEELRLASRVFDAGTESIVVLDPQFTILAVNKAFTKVTGFSREDVVGRANLAEGQPDAVRNQYMLLRASIEEHGFWQGESFDIRKNGEIYPQWLQVHVVRDDEEKITHIVGFFTDLTERRQTEERLSYLTQYDELTELANRALFHQRLQQAVERARQTEGCIALMHIDLDRFKVLNDSLGVEVADQVLRTISHRLTTLLPEVDTLARLAGNEFAVILDSGVSNTCLEQLAASILSTIRVPIEVAGNELIISASLGISVLPDNARESAALISQTSMAMQHAKHLGGDNFQFYNNQLQASTLERLQLEQQLRRGIEEGQLQAYYQPKLTLSDGVVRSAEALVRWNHPQRGLVPPDEFITLAEEIGLIGSISELMLQQACEQALLWLQQGMPIRVSVNLSVSHVRQGNLVTLVQDVLQKTGLPAYLLELELTESQMLENAESVIATFKQLREIGVHLAIDDFGTGYSSLSYLKRFPANSLKIDQSFIRDVSSNDEDAAITRAIIAMAHGLNLLVVAEGVETQAQMDFLEANLCDEIQGYLICRPVPAEQFTDFLVTHQQEQTELCLS